MNTVQKFSGFLLLPLLTFLLGFGVATHYQTSARGSSSFLEQRTAQQGTPEKLNLAILDTALRNWEESKNPPTATEKKDFESVSAQLKLFAEQSAEVNLQGFWEALATVREKYVDPAKIDATKIAGGVIRGMVASLGDQYSSYLSAEESTDFDTDLAGELNGIGAELTLKNELVTVISPIKGSPASSAGLLPEDVILKVNDEDIQGQDLNSVVKKIRGPEGTKVKLTILRSGSSELLEKEIERRHIVVESVTLKLENKVAILEVKQFGDRTEAEFEKNLRDALAKSPRGIILDLRFNPGGYLETAVKMASAFIKEGKVVIQEERAPKVTSKFVTGKVMTDLPIVVLINKGSASAAEIVAGALQDHGRAVIVGEQSFGKGTVQELIPLADGANLRLTVAKWLTPNGRDIGKKGITPDVEIKRTPEDFAAEKDPQLEAAMKILTGELKVDTSPTPATAN